MPARWLGIGVGGHLATGMRPLPRRKGPSAEELLADPARVVGRRHGVAHRPGVCEDLVVVPAL